MDFKILLLMLSVVCCVNGSEPSSVLPNSVDLLKVQLTSSRNDLKFLNELISTAKKKIELVENENLLLKNRLKAKDAEFEVERKVIVAGLAKAYSDRCEIIRREVKAEFEECKKRDSALIAQQKSEIESLRADKKAKTGGEG